ncbi:zinc-binding dehydrogenase [Pedobacter suwonensis]|uniref:zinc-binding dehydrogenase n=1 Tax=Pedobacter suwonensis TaxID=332999 RepID=UPI000B871303|nr:zinc-binding dehydrogenase [Pedobacter suwonensis]
MRNAYYTNDVYASGIYQQKRMNQILAVVAKYPLNAPIQEVCSLKDAAKAHYLIQSGTVFGKIILIN